MAGYFVLMKSPTAKPGGRQLRMLCNLDVTFCYVEREDGMADAVAITGATVPTGELFETVLKDMGEDKG